MLDPSLGINEHDLIIAQYKVALSPDDSVDDIAEKEHELEMKYFPKVVEQVLLDV